MEEQASKKQEDQRKFFEYSSKTQGDLEWHFSGGSYLTLSPFCAATRRNSNLVTDD
jgi:hypothetical protein